MEQVGVIDEATETELLDPAVLASVPPEASPADQLSRLIEARVAELDRVGGDNRGEAGLVEAAFLTIACAFGNEPCNLADAFAFIDRLEVEMMRFPALECPVTHRFTPGLYSRELFAPAGALITSKIHTTEHLFVVSRGRATVFTAHDGVVEYQAPYAGRTLPGTRRVVFAHEDTVWTTFHANPENETDPEKIMNRITFRHDRHTAGMEQPKAMCQAQPGELL